MAPAVDSCALAPLCAYPVQLKVTHGQLHREQHPSRWLSPTAPSHLHQVSGDAAGTSRTPPKVNYFGIAGAEQQPQLGLRGLKWWPGFSEAFVIGYN